MMWKAVMSHLRAVMLSLAAACCLQLLILLCSVQTCLAAQQPVDSLLIEDILSGYDPRVLARVDNKPLLVNVGFTLVQLHSLDEKNQMLTSSGWFQVEWNDYRLKWNETKYNRSNVVIPSRELWLPDIGFLNSASIYHTSMIKNEFRCVVYSDGSVLWVPGGTYYTTCELNISKFPFDSQMCYLHLTNWAYNIGEMNLTMPSETITMDSYKISAEWDIVKTKVSREEVVYECCGNVSYPSLFYYVWIQRKSLYYVVNIILPCVILSMLATFTFCVPPDSGEKVSLGITLLLSFTVFQLIVADSIPRRSDSVPVISLYISVITGTVTASIICTIFITQLHHRGAVPLPHALRTVTFDILARLVCLNSLRKAHGTATTNRGHHKQRQRQQVNGSGLDPEVNENGYSGSGIGSGRFSKVSCSITGSGSCRMRLLNGQSPITVESELLETSMSSESACSYKADSHLSGKYLHSIENKLDFITEALAEYERRRIDEASSVSMREEWAAAAKVYDRFFFIIFVILMVIVTLKFLIPEEDGDQDIQQWGMDIK